MMGLRLTDGIDARRYKAMSGNDLSANTLTRLEEIGMIVQDRHYIRATAEGRMVLNAVIKELLSD